jgi:hypothetical protein
VGEERCPAVPVPEPRGDDPQTLFVQLAVDVVHSRVAEGGDRDSPSSGDEAAYEVEDRLSLARTRWPVHNRQRVREGGVDRLPLAQVPPEREQSRADGVVMAGDPRAPHVQCEGAVRVYEGQPPAHAGQVVVR